MTENSKTDGNAGETRLMGRDEKKKKKVLGGYKPKASQKQTEETDKETVRET